MHIKWWVKVPSDLWTDENGQPFDRQIKTAAILFQRSDRPRPKPKRWTIDEVNKAAKTNKWKLLENSDKLLSTDLLVYRYSPLINTFKNVKTMYDHIDRPKFLCIRMASPLTAALKKKLDDQYRKIANEKKEYYTTGIVGVNLEDVSTLMKVV